MKKIKKFLEVEVKAAEDGTGAWWFTASTDARDRQGDVVVQNGWKTADFMKNPVILWAHNYYETPIGKALEMKMSPTSISAKIKFASEIDPFAKKVEDLVAGGFLKTVSVGFMVYKTEALTTEDLQQRPEMKYGQRLYGDLLEISMVPVPANPQAMNENNFADIVSRGWGLKPDESKSKFLPYADDKGVINARLLRASLAVALGARGGVKITDADPAACENHLRRIAKENGIELPCYTEGQPSQAQLKEAFRDVWHEEILEVIHRAEENTEDGVLKLVKGNRRKQLMAARDALNMVLSLSETEEGPLPPKTPNEPEPDVETAAAVTDIIKDLEELNKNLAGK